MIKNKLFLFFGGVILLLVVSISAIWLGGCAKVVETIAKQTAGAPSVASVNPVNGGTNVFLNTKAVSATFDNDMDTASAALSLSSAQGAVTGTVTCSAKTIKFVPANDLAANVTYTASVPATVKSTAGKALGAVYSWTFTTGTQQDTTAPTVDPVFPADQAVSVAVNAAITATFDKDMDSSTLTAATFTVASAAQAVTGNISYDAANKKAVFTPTVNLFNNVTYTATVAAGVKDITGNALATNKTWSFTTVAGGTASDCNTVLLPANVFGGCSISLVTPAKCEEIDLSGGKTYQFAWTTLGPSGFTWCETPYVLIITNDPPTRYVKFELSSLNDPLITKDGGGIANISALSLTNSGMPAVNGTYHWVVTGWHGSHPDDRVFKIKF